MAQRYRLGRLTFVDLRRQYVFTSGDAQHTNMSVCRHFVTDATLVEALEPPLPPSSLWETDECD
jgi:hypothetical protein